MEPKIITPYGFRVLRVLSILNILIVIATIVAYKLPTSPLSELSSLLSVYTFLSFAFSIVVAVLTIVAINKRSAKLYKVVLWLFGLEILGLVISIFTARNLDYASNIISFIIPALFFIWYWVKMKGFFIDPNFNPEDPTIKKIDKKVNPFLITWIILIVIISIVMAGFKVAGTVKDTFKYIEAFEGKTLQENISYCQTESKSDECLLSAFSFEDNKEKDSQEITVDMCNLITKQEMKIVCYARIDKCEAVTDENLNTICEYTSQKFKNEQKVSTSSEPITNN